MLESVGRTLEMLVPAFKLAAEAFSSQFQQAMHSANAASAGPFTPPAPAASAARAAPLSKESAAVQTFTSQLNKMACGTHITLGRDATQAQILSNNPNVSPKHATIGRDLLGNFSISNAGGKETSIERGGKAIAVPKYDFVQLQPGDVIRLGGARGETFHMPGTSHTNAASAPAAGSGFFTPAAAPVATNAAETFKPQGRSSVVAAATPPGVAGGKAAAAAEQGRNIYAQVSALSRGSSLTLGRDATQSQVVCTAVTTSRVHATITRDGSGDMMIRNISGRPTAVERDGKPITVNAGMPVKLEPGDKVRLGGPQGEAFSLKDTRAEGLQIRNLSSVRNMPISVVSTNPQQTPTMPEGVKAPETPKSFKTPASPERSATPVILQPATPAVATPVQTPAVPQRSVVKAIAQLKPQNDGFVVGRAVGEVGVYVRAPLVSAQHAKVYRDAAGVLMVADLKSTNGTVIERGGKTIQVKPGTPQAVQPGDVLRFGGKSGPGYQL